MEPELGTYQAVRGQVALVTGAGAGIGRAVARTLANAGASVVCVNSNAERGAETVRQIERDGGTASSVVTDITDESAVDALVADVVRAHGRLDVLCNNAGVLDTMANPESLTTEEWDRVLRINLTAPFLLTRATLPHMLAHKHGRVINIASESGLRGGAGGAAYTASKHGLVGLTRNLAWMHAQDGIRANAICPGPVNTYLSGQENSQHLDPAGLARLGPVMALGERMAEPAEIANVVLFLASPQAAFVNGAVVPVDGGWSAG